MNDLESATRDELLCFVSDLQGRIQQLEEQVRFLGNHPTLARGMAGERLALLSIPGTATPHTSPSDILLADGRIVEVKTAFLPPLQPGKSRRWAWEKIFGQKNGKSFDYLLLAGEADARFADQYKNSASAFIFFLVPFAEVSALTTNGVEGTRKIQLNTNPSAGRVTPSSIMFERYQVTSNELTGLIDQR